MKLSNLMKFFVDAANIQDIKAVMEKFPFLVGVTTTPEILLNTISALNKEYKNLKDEKKVFLDDKNQKDADRVSKRMDEIEKLLEGDYKDVPSLIKGILKVVDELHIEAIGMTKDEIVADAKKQIEDYGIDKGKVVFKIPANTEGIAAAGVLKEDKFKIHLHMVNAYDQGVMSLMANPDYISVLIGKNLDNGIDSMPLIDNLQKLITKNNLDTFLMATSLRHRGDFISSINLGVKSITAKPENYISSSNNFFTDTIYSKFFTADFLMKKVSVKMNKLDSISDDKIVDEALLSMNDVGTLAITNSDNKPVGVLTEGDIKRLREEFGKDFLSFSLKEAGLIKGVKVIKQDALLKEALPFFKGESPVDTLIVVDDKGYFVGYLDEKAFIQ